MKIFRTSHKTIEEEVKELRNFSVKEKEFLTDLRKKLTVYTADNPIGEKTEAKTGFAGFLFLNVIMKKFRSMPALLKVAGVYLAIIMVGTSGVAIASQRSLPGDALYPVKLFSEDVGIIISFSPESKAKMNITFAERRIEEIMEILEGREVEPKGLEIALSQLQRNTEKAAITIRQEKEKGNDVSDLARTINESLSQNKNNLREAFNEQLSNLKSREQEIKERIRKAKDENDIFHLAVLNSELKQIKELRKVLIEQMKENTKILDAREENAEEEMKEEEKILDSKKDAQEEIEEAEEEKRKIESEAEKEGIALSEEIFNIFIDMIVKAKEEFGKDNYDQAESYAKQAKESLENVEKIIEEMPNLEDKENQEDQEDDEADGQKNENNMENSNKNENKENINEYDENKNEEGEKSEGEVKGVKNEKENSKDSRSRDNDEEDDD